MSKSHIRKDDTVFVLAGRDKGKTKTTPFSYSPAATRARRVRC